MSLLSIFLLVFHVSEACSNTERTLDWFIFRLLLVRRIVDFQIFASPAVLSILSTFRGKPFVLKYLLFGYISNTVKGLLRMYRYSL